MKSKSAHRRWAWGSASLVALLAAAPAAISAPAEPVLTFAIAGGTLEGVLTAYAAQAHVQLLYTPDVVRGRRSEGLSGAFTAKAALARLLDGAGITAQQSRPGVIVLRIGLIANSEQTLQAEVAQAAPTMLDEVVVTGSHIRGVGPGPAPVVSLDRDEIDRQGRATVADTLSNLPQNFSGSANPAVLTTGVDVTSQNAGRATAVNLRGLGADATLVLVNGRRMAGTGGKGDFADVSAIPTAAVQRVDVLLDGASALYGSDAVGGVVNIILRRDFDGAETRARFGAAQGGATETQFAQTFGKAWSTGRALISYEYYQRNALAFADRSYTQSADLRSLGGTDRRTNISSPGNIVLVDPVTNAATPTWGIPAGVSPLLPSSFIRGVVNLQEPRAGQDLLPDQDRHSLYASFGQELGDRIEASGDVRYSRRTFSYASLSPSASITVADNNPYFVSPNGARSNQIYYSFNGDLGPSIASGSSESLGVSAGLDAKLWGDWKGEAYLAFARELVRSATDHNLNSLFLREAVGATADNSATPFKTSVDGFFNPYGSGQANSRAVLDFIGSGYSRQRYESQVASFNAQADGKVVTLPGGDLRLAVGVHGRRETFDQVTSNFQASVAPTLTTRPTSERNIVAGFAEARIPLVGPNNARPGIQALEVSLAARVEHYDDAGTTTNPKVGVMWSPATGLRLRATYGTSFRAPTLTEVYAAPAISNVQYLKGAARVLSLTLTGGNLDLKPETAKSWTAGFDYEPQAVPGLKLSATVFDTNFTNQIDRPVSQNANAALTEPAFAPFVRLLNPANPADLAYVQSLLSDPAYTTPGLYPANAFGAVVDTRYVNTSTLHVRGLDLSAAYRFDLGDNRFDLGISGSYLFDYQQQLTPTSSTLQRVGIASYPVDLRARAALNWTRDTLGATFTLNYVDDYRAETGRKIDSWTTADLQVRWTPTGKRLEGLTLAASVQNLFDTDPPFYDSPNYIGFDPTNADPLGRVASLQLTKRW